MFTAIHPTGCGASSHRCWMGMRQVIGGIAVVSRAPDPKQDAELLREEEHEQRVGCQLDVPTAHTQFEGRNNHKGVRR